MVAASKGNQVGEDTDLAWNDDHLSFVYFWLTENEQSPYKGSPTMLFKAMDVDSTFWNTLKKGFRARKLFIRFSVRIRLTAKFKVVLSGSLIPRIEKVDKNGRVRSASIVIAPDPQPLPIPGWIKGTVRLTGKGLQLMVKGTPHLRNTDKNKLTNPFGVR